MEARRKPIKPHYREAEIEALYNEGLSNAKIAKQTGVNKRIVDDTVEHIRIRQEAKAEPTITSVMLSLTAQKKLELAIKQHTAQLDREFNVKLQAAVRRYLDITSDELQKEQAEAKRIMNARQGLMTRATYKQILACLHPDWVVDPKQKVRYEDAFREFAKLEKLLLSEKESPTSFVAIPRTAAEWEALRRKTKRPKRTNHAPVK